MTIKKDDSEQVALHDFKQKADWPISRSILVEKAVIEWTRCSNDGEKEAEDFSGIVI